jgi:DNA-binding IclR family transcriptional regulator
MLNVMPTSPRTPPRRSPPGAAAPLVLAATRAPSLLDRLAQRREPMSLAQLTHELALPKSSVHGLCNTLMSFGCLRRERDGAFMIGPRVMSLAETFVAGTGVALEFNALWTQAGAAPKETVVLSVLSGTDALFVAVRNSARPLGLAYNVGMRLPAHLSASGRAMLSHREPDEVRALFAGGLNIRLTRKGPRGIEALLRELALTRRRGYSIDDEAVREGLHSFGAPVFDATGRAVAGVAVRLNKAPLGAGRGARHRDAVIAVSRRLSQRLGGEVAAPGLVARRRRTGNLS